MERFGDVAPDMVEARSMTFDGMSEGEMFAVLGRAGVAMVLTNPRLPDNPIVYVNDAFERVTGYQRAAIVGRNCRFLQGRRTDPDHRRTLREAIAAGREVVVDILNYRADGSSYRNLLMIAPVHGPGRQVSYFLGIQLALPSDEPPRVTADDAMREIQHRVKNHLAMIVGLIRIQARESVARDEYDTLARRVESLQLLYEEMSDAGLRRDPGRIELGAYLGRVCGAIAEIDGRPGIRVAIDMGPLPASVDTAARIGLILSEVVTNALEHAFQGRQDGFLEVRLAATPAGGARVSVSDDGIGIRQGVTWPDMDSTGGRIVEGLVGGLDADLRVETGPGGTRVTLDVPAAMIDS